MRLRSFAVLALAVTAVTTTAGPAGAAAPPPRATTTVGGHSGGLAAADRRQIVNRAVRALTTPRHFRLTTHGRTYTSTPGVPNRNTNYLGRGGSNLNLNEYNRYNGDPWCGHFAAAVWNYRGVPARYGSSQAWRTGVGSRFHRYSASRLPQPGDVLVWTNKGDSAHGHVGVVTAVSRRAVTTVEGNTGYHNDSIIRRSYSWSGAGPALRGKTFRGFTTAP